MEFELAKQYYGVTDRNNAYMYGETQTLDDIMEIPRILMALHRPALMTHVDCNFFNSDEEVYNLRMHIYTRQFSATT